MLSQQDTPDEYPTNFDRNMTIRVLGLCGSLRSDSFNAIALRLAGELMPEGMTLDIQDIRPIPMFDADLLVHGFPEPVRLLRESVRAADAVLIASPEYNFSVPGVLKNTLDWISRGDDQPFVFKPVAVLSASTGPVGGARMQYDLRKIMLFMNALVMAKPEVFIGMAAGKFNNGECTDDTTRKYVGEQMAALQRWVSMVRRMRQE